MTKEELHEAVEAALGPAGRMDNAHDILWDECEALRQELKEALDTSILDAYESNISATALRLEKENASLRQGVETLTEATERAQEVMEMVIAFEEACKDSTPHPYETAKAWLPKIRAALRKTEGLATTNQLPVSSQSSSSSDDEAEGLKSRTCDKCGAVADEPYELFRLCNSCVLAALERPEE